MCCLDDKLLSAQLLKVITGAITSSQHAHGRDSLGSTSGAKRIAGSIRTYLTDGQPSKASNLRKRLRSEYHASRKAKKHNQILMRLLKWSSETAQEPHPNPSEDCICEWHSQMRQIKGYLDAYYRGKPAPEVEEELEVEPIEPGDVLYKRY